MELSYLELKEFVAECYGNFRDWGFTSEQIVAATLDECKYGSGFNDVEETCIYLSLLDFFTNDSFDTKTLKEQLTYRLLPQISKNIKGKLGNDYDYFASDVRRLLNFYGVVK